MPSRADLKWSQLKVGMVVAIATAVLLVVFFAMSAETGLFHSHIRLVTYVENAANLHNGAVVDLQGVRIGNVTRVHIASHPPNSTYPVRIDMQVEANHSRWLRTNSQVELGTTTFLGETIVNIRPGTSAAPAAVNGTVLPAMNATGISQLLVSSHSVLQNANELELRLGKILDQIQYGKSSIGRFIYTDTLYRRFDQIAANVSSLTHAISTGQGTIGKLIVSRTMYDKLNHTLDSLNATLDAVRSGHGTAAKLINDPSLYNHLNRLAKNLNSTVTAINQGKGTLGQLVENRQLAVRLQNTVDNLNAILAGVRAGKGSAGQLFNNPQLYQRLNTTLNRASQLLREIRKNPRKYLTLHLKIF